MKKLIFSKNKNLQILVVRGLSAKYSNMEFDVLKNISFKVASNDFLSIIGSNGAGKSTLIRCLNRLVEPTAGEIYFNGEYITKLSKGSLRKSRRNIGMIFQEFNLVENVSVLDNVLTGRLGFMNICNSLLKTFPSADIDTAYKIVEEVGLKEYANTKVSLLSGGQRQKVGIARALMQNPKILLVDEPTSNLDPVAAFEILRLIKQISKTKNIPIICNIHDVSLAMKFSNRIIGLKTGSIVFNGTPETLDERKLKNIYNDT